eukprot:2778396-Amphidinium_carterae.1
MNKFGFQGFPFPGYIFSCPSMQGSQSNKGDWISRERSLFFGIEVKKESWTPTFATIRMPEMPKVSVKTQQMRAS